MSGFSSGSLVPKSQTDDPLRACVHCGLCLESCPTYRLSGDENNSPRGRLLLWRAEEEGRLEPDPWTDFYTDECVGCLACQPVCPANVPYGLILERTRHRLREEGRTKVRPAVAAAGKAVRHPALFDAAFAPARLLRKAGLLRHRMVFAGKPAAFKSTASYARKLMERHQPSGPSVALLTGCLMEALFREINFATVRVLIENNFRVVIPEGQGCCGALHEHTGMEGVEALAETNQKAFKDLPVDCVASNSAGCGLALSKALGDSLQVTDITGLLGSRPIRARPERESRYRVFVDLPCHLVHGRGESIPEAVLDATGYNWEWAPCAADCCGSGGVYNVQKPDNARKILEGKAAFLEELPRDCHPIIATSNHVCMMQWNTARRFVKRPFSVRHVVQLLDPGDEF